MHLDTVTKYPFLHSGELYASNMPELFMEQRQCLKAMDEFNRTAITDLEGREALLPQMFDKVGKGCFVEAPILMNFGGNHVRLGDNVYINYGFIAVDDTFITIGDNTMIGPRVTIATAVHPEDIELRSKAYQYNKPVTIGKNVWIAANVTILPGVTIGDGSIIGAGSVVTKDIPENVVAIGTPCKVIRPIRPEDKSNIKY